MNPPVQRMVLLAALEEWLLTSNEPGSLAAQEYWDGTVYPEGFAHLDAVELDGMLPVFRWTVEGRTIGIEGAELYVLILLSASGAALMAAPLDERQSISGSP